MALLEPKQLMVSVKNNSFVFIEAVTSTPLSMKNGLGCKDVKSNIPSQPEASVT